jgi:hypothetical protein
MKHQGILISGEVTCDCGWKSGHYALAEDACLAHDVHIKESDEGNGSN